MFGRPIAFRPQAPLAYFFRVFWPVLLWESSATATEEDMWECLTLVPPTAPALHAKWQSMFILQMPPRHTSSILPVVRLHTESASVHFVLALPLGRSARSHRSASGRCRRGPGCLAAIMGTGILIDRLPSRIFIQAGRMKDKQASNLKHCPWRRREDGPTYTSECDGWSGRREGEEHRGIFLCLC